LNLLAKQTDEKIIEFKAIQEWFGRKANTSNLCAIAYIVNDYISDDVFTDYRHWLISEGKEKYFTLLQHPESLVNVYNHKDEIKGFSEEFYLVTDYAYEKKHPESETPYYDFIELYSSYKNKNTKYIYNSPPVKDDWETMEDLKKMFPNFYNKFH